MKRIKEHPARPLARADGERSRTAWERFFVRIEELKAKPRRPARQLELSQC